MRPVAQLLTMGALKRQVICRPSEFSPLWGCREALMHLAQVKGDAWLSEGKVAHMEHCAPLECIHS